jgi:hypothetical protein
MPHGSSRPWPSRVDRIAFPAAARPKNSRRAPPSDRSAGHPRAASAEAADDGSAGAGSERRDELAPSKNGVPKAMLEGQSCVASRSPCTRRGRKLLAPTHRRARLHPGYVADEQERIPQRRPTEGEAHRIAKLERFVDGNARPADAHVLDKNVSLPSRRRVRRKRVEANRAPAVRPKRLCTAHTTVVAVGGHARREEYHWRARGPHPRRAQARRYASPTRRGPGGIGFFGAGGVTMRRGVSLPSSAVHEPLLASVGR